MGKSRRSHRSSNVDWDGAGDDIESLCNAAGYQLTINEEGDYEIYDSEYDTKLVITSTFQMDIDYVDEVYDSIYETNSNSLKDILKAYNEAPNFLKEANQIILFDDKSNHKGPSGVGDWLGYHASYLNSHGIIINEQSLHSKTNPLYMVLYHEMSHGLDFSTSDDYGRKYSLSRDIVKPLVDKYGSATAYSKNNYGKEFSDEQTRYMEDLAEIIGITASYKYDKNFKVIDVDGKTVKAEKWVGNHKELYDWANNFMNSHPENNIDDTFDFPLSFLKNNY